MFETSVARAVPSRGKYTLLTASLIAHSAVIVGAIVIGIASVSFPKNAPDEFAIPLIPVAVTIPPPLGNPNATGQPQKPPQPQVQKQATAPLPTQPVAPPVIPDNVTPVDSASTTGTESAIGPATGVPGPIGVPWGTEGSVGPIDAPPATATQAPVENKIYSVGEVKAPVILHRVEPLYPGVLQRATAQRKSSGPLRHRQERSRA